MELRSVFMFLSVFSILFFFLVLTKKTFIAQLLGPAIPEPYSERMEDMKSWIQPF
jgi:hypothetical protein